jgi:hypothetical protein
MALEEPYFKAKKDVSDGAVSEPTDCLVLDDYLGQEIVEISGRLEGIRSYAWRTQANYEQAEDYCLTALSARKNGIEEAIDFFVEAIHNVFNFDRALRASLIHELPKPIRDDEVLESITRGSQRYELRRRKFKWSASVPSEAVNKASKVVRSDDPPDAFWIAEYERVSSTYDPIIYASYGSWHVEVARWD